MVRRPTVYDVAERAGVSIATVSFTFRQPHRVKRSTKENVLAAAKELGYVPSGNARGLARGRTGALGIYSFDYYSLGPGQDPDSAAGSDGAKAPAFDDSNPDLRSFPVYVDEVQRGVALECRRRGYTLIVSGGNQAGSETAFADIAGQVDGLAVFPRSVSDDVLESISRMIPVVEFSERSHTDTLSGVTCDNAGGMRLLTEHLISTHGFKDLQFVGPSRIFPDSLARYEGFQTQLRSSGFAELHDPLVAEEGAPGWPEKLMENLLAQESLPEVLVCAQDEIALGLMGELSAHGISVPDQIAVTGFDGIAAGLVSSPQLTTIKQPMELMGRTAVGILLDRFEHPETAAQSLELPVQLVVRQSCGCLPL
ncbi:LacI family DNA-binding transcriptional regulator [Arthrobacter sp. ISL-48]|uniref:LacI family DNA-binding transcriptional regulator n=1 Tax=Arthrobacter sp. ISL-48 TaxID=2819110 RepID=UPI001BE98D44|nr:LacI family DNA-binding transcriptional regulator [Arthrobacter sp. ISL-48]MBT2531379.1 LacI family DNA-binding transcriptional regulator [Arthrobacter sp. ISL-48]